MKLINVGIKKRVLDNFYLKMWHDIHDMSSCSRDNFDGQTTMWHSMYVIRVKFTEDTHAKGNDISVFQR